MREIKKNNAESNASILFHEFSFIRFVQIGDGEENLNCDDLLLTHVYNSIGRSTTSTELMFICDRALLRYFSKALPVISKPFKCFQIKEAS